MRVLNVASMAAAAFGSKIIKTVASHPFGYAEVRVY